MSNTFSFILELIVPFNVFCLIYENSFTKVSLIKSEDKIEISSLLRLKLQCYYQPSASTECCCCCYDQPPKSCTLSSNLEGLVLLVLLTLVMTAEQKSVPPSLSKRVIYLHLLLICLLKRER